MDVFALTGVLQALLVTTVLYAAAAVV